MADTNSNGTTTTVNDLRRFDPEGNPRVDEAEGFREAPPQEETSTATGSAAESAPAAEFEKAKLVEELEASRRRVNELARAYQALNQDREEFKQRLTRERERMIDVERGNVALHLLEAIDELDRCLGASTQEMSPLAEGVRLIRDGLLAKVQQAGIERINVVGQSYDPNTAEASDMEITPHLEEDQRVVAEVRAGYRLKDRIIRPARVKVAKYVQPANA